MEKGKGDQTLKAEQSRTVIAAVADAAVTTDAAFTHESKRPPLSSPSDAAKEFGSRCMQAMHTTELYSWRGLGSKPCLSRDRSARPGWPVHIVVLPKN